MSGSLDAHCIVCVVQDDLVRREGPAFEGLKSADAGALGFLLGWQVGSGGYDLSLCTVHADELGQLTEAHQDLLERFAGQASDSEHPVARAAVDAENDVEADGRDD